MRATINFGRHSYKTIAAENLAQVKPAGLVNIVLEDCRASRDQYKLKRGSFMFKSNVLAFALFGVAGAASAQSGITIYGSVDLALAKSNGGLSNQPNQVAATTSNSYQVVQGHQNRIGFRGNEDLGGGLSAQFQIDHRFNADTGAQTNASSFWHGLSYVQLSSTSLGKVYLGRNYTPGFLQAVRVDPFGWDGVGEFGVMQMANYRTPDPSVTSVASNNGRSVTAPSVRESNAVGYISPSFNGLSVHTSVGLSEATNNGRIMALALNYESGPIYFGVSAEKVYKGSYQDQGIYIAAASYDLGVTKLMGYFARSSYGVRVAANGVTTFSPAVLTPNGSNMTHAKVYGIGTITPIGGGAIKAGFLLLNPDGINNTAKKLGLGYDYFLSKRTKVYLDGGYAKEDTLSKNKIVALGVRHDF